MNTQTQFQEWTSFIDSCYSIDVGKVHQFFRGLVREICTDLVVTYGINWKFTVSTVQLKSDILRKYLVFDIASKSRYAWLLCYVCFCRKLLIKKEMLREMRNDHPSAKGFQMPMYYVWEWLENIFSNCTVSLDITSQCIVVWKNSWIDLELHVWLSSRWTILWLFNVEEWWIWDKWGVMEGALWGWLVEAECIILIVRNNRQNYADCYHLWRFEKSLPRSLCIWVGVWL